jgi:hypothetical protein
MFFGFVHVTLEQEEISLGGPEFSIVFNSIYEYKVAGVSRQCYHLSEKCEY